MGGAGPVALTHVRACVVRYNFVMVRSRSTGVRQGARGRTIAALLACALVTAVAFATSATSVPAATGSSTVGATVLSATSIGAGGCPPLSAGVTSFGALAPGASVVTSSNCVVTFGSSNDVSRLRIGQGDGRNQAMFRTTSGAGDSGFSGDGVASAPILAGDDQVSSVVVQPDGKPVVTGRTWNGSLWIPFIARFTEAGAIDGTFGSGGSITFPTIDIGTWDAPAIGLHPDGRIIVVGNRMVQPSNMFVIRTLADGSPDTSVGAGGIRLMNQSAGGNGAWFDEVAFDASGRILVSGRAWGSGWSTMLVRLNAGDASFDTTFDGDGTTTTVCTGAGGAGGGTSLELQPDGKVLVAGYDTWGGSWHTQVLRYTSTGVLDGTFGTGGCLDTGFAGGQTSDGLLLDSAGRILIGGMSSPGTVRRLLPSGATDTTFGTSGTVTLGSGSGTVRGIHEQADGTYLLGGVWGNAFQTVRLSSSGAIDTTYGTAGVATITAGADANQGNEVEMVPTHDGRFVLAGTDTSNGTAFDAMVVRTDSTRVADYQSGVNTWSLGGPTGVFAACLRNATLGAVTDGTTWTSNGGTACTATDSGLWKGVPDTTGSAGSTIARTSVTTTEGATATFQFGFRAAASQPPGSYVAPVTFEVIAP
ncbi:MAG: hypothetical protein JWM86_1738 [Thermoleophilia bacterium]|nr:hypothetical protein [Thermoleophilia bacterium]